MIVDRAMLTDWHSLERCAVCGASDRHSVTGTNDYGVVAWRGCATCIMRWLQAQGVPSVTVIDTNKEPA